jgi:nitrogen-specific signal transduction histidine kinase
MDNRIKDIVETKYTVKSYMERGYDEEIPLISFAPEDLASVIKGVIHVCAEMVSTADDEQKLLKFAEGI